MTTLFETGKFWIIDAATGAKVQQYPPFDTWREARDVIGDRWTEADALFPDLDL